MGELHGAMKNIVIKNDKMTRTFNGSKLIINYIICNFRTKDFYHNGSNKIQYNF